jgi:citrate lyase gamma subunit
MYIVQQTVNGCTSADTVWVNVNSLPLKFISYSVISKVVRNLEKSVENLWQTANETNVSHYNIERSTNAKDFTTIGKVKANNKAANEYNFTDLLTTNYSLLTTLYYRVVGVDFDGKKTYSEVRQLAMGKEQLAISIFPNPAKDVVHIAGDNIQQIVISTIEGKRILNSTLKKIDVGNLQKGVYIISVYTTKGNIKNEKLIVY